MFEPPYRTKNFVKGMIILWYGTIANIPNGWSLCDGSLNTPDLRNRFVVGAGDTYAVGDNAAAPTHTHSFTGDGHAHRFPVGTSLLYVPDFWWRTDTQPAIGTTDTETPLPPYKALCYIMKWN